MGDEVTATESDGVYHLSLMDRLILSLRLCSFKESPEHIADCIPDEVKAVIIREARKPKRNQAA